MSAETDFFPLPAPYEAAFAAATVLAVEVDIDVGREPGSRGAGCWPNGARCPIR